MSKVFGNGANALRVLDTVSVAIHQNEFFTLLCPYGCGKTTLLRLIAAVYTTIEWLQPGSFASSSGTPIAWQQMVYYSYITLTTGGYGDITPVGLYAQAFAAFEGVVGVLYTVILLARLVGLHASGSGRS